jgi:pyruvate dehydrogenase E2 component (dihydrolipoamide acetyltransferase)
MWGKAVGDEVVPGDVLAQIETDKATVDYEMQEEGFVAKLLYPEGAEGIELGKIVAILVENKEDIAAFANWSESAEAAPVSAPTPVAVAAPVKAAAPKVQLPYHIKLEMPNLSPTMEKGNIQTWGMKVGDAVAPGDVLAQIETDKATVDYEMQEEGFLAKLMYPEGAQGVELGKCVAILVENVEDIAAFADYVEGAEEAAEVVVAAEEP